MSDIFLFLGALTPGVARAFGMLIVLPLGEGVSLVSRSFLSFVIGAIVSSHAGLGSHEPFNILAVGEGLLIGALVGLPIALAVESAAGLGELFDAGRGQLMAQTYDPLMNITSSQLGLLFRAGYWALLLHQGAFELAISLLVRTPALSTVQANCLTSQVIYTAQHLGQLTILCACVFSGCFLVIDTGLGFASKIVKGMSFSNGSFLLKFFAGMLVLFMTSLWDIPVPAPVQLHLCMPS